jgi:hypothetical protein
VRWERVIDEAEGTVMPGQWNMQMVFGMLASGTLPLALIDSC